ncbi:helix-turn-helix domain-containing protein [Alloscardovia omnicolens]
MTTTPVLTPQIATEIAEQFEYIKQLVEPYTKIAEQQQKLKEVAPSVDADSLPGVKAANSLTRQVSENVRNLLRYSGYTQKQLADFIELSTSSVSQKMAGQVAWTLIDIEKAAKFFNIEPAVLVGPQGLEPWTQRL